MPHFLPIYRLTENYSREKFLNFVHASAHFKKPWHSLDQDWFGNSISPACAFHLLLDSDYLHFLTAQTHDAVGHPEQHVNKYMEELWKYDVGELFLFNPANGEYLEFNLSPLGAWWSCAFSLPRQMKPLESQKLEDIRVYHTKTEHFYFNCLSIPRRSIEKATDLRMEHGQGNVTFVGNSPKQKFISFSALPGKQPNFHQPQHFAKLQINDFA